MGAINETGERKIDRYGFLTVELANELFTYDQDTGVISWADYKTNGMKPGAVAGSVSREINIMYKGKNHKAHRVAWMLFYKELPPRYIDHIDRDPTNNRIVNLRSATMADNQHNKSLHRNNTSGYKGVTWDKTKRKWRAEITISWRSRFLGRYDTAKDAAKAYDRAALHLFGEFAHINGVA